MPASLRPKPAAAIVGTNPPAADEPIDVHVAIVVPHPKIAQLIKDKVVVGQPQTGNIRLHAHVVLNDPKHPAARIDFRVRTALVEMGLVDPDQVGFTFPEQVTLGWPKETEPDG